MSLIENLEWRYATKKFDSAKKISTENLAQIKRAIQLSASSYGLQLYKVFIIEDTELRAKLKAVSYGQDQITDASHLIVFCNYTEVTATHVDEYIALKARVEGVAEKDLQGYADFIKADVLHKSDLQKEKWLTNQTYLALGNLLNACAALKIHSCPMEGFDAEKYNEILGLQKQGLNASVIATIGYRSIEDTAWRTKKVRKSMEELFRVYTSDNLIAKR